MNGAKESRGNRKAWVAGAYVFVALLLAIGAVVYWSAMPGPTRPSGRPSASAIRPEAPPAPVGSREEKAVSPTQSVSPLATDRASTGALAAATPFPAASATPNPALMRALRRVLSASNETTTTRAMREARERGEAERAANTATVSGRVTDLLGQPVAGVSVEFTAVTAGRGWRNVIAQATTGADGAYRAESVRAGDMMAQAIPWAYVRPGDYAPWTTRSAAPDLMASDPVSLTLSAGEHRDNVDFQLNEGDAITGTVTDPDKRPIQGASVTATAGENDYEGRFTKRTLTDSDGVYRIGGLPINEPIARLEAGCRGYEPASRETVTPKDGPQNFVLKPVPDLMLVAVDRATGQRVLRYTSRLLVRGWSGFDYYYGGPGSRKVSDENGETPFSVNRPAGGGVVFRADVAELDGAGNATGRGGSVTFSYDEIAKSGAATVTAIVDGARTLRGEARWGAEDGPVVEGATVQVQRNMRSVNAGVGEIPPDPFFDPPAVMTSFEGKFALGGVLPGTQRLLVEKDKKRPVKSPVEVVVEPGRDPDPIVVVLSQTGAAVFGVARDAKARPIVGVTIFARPHNEFMNNRNALQGTTDDEGRYRVEGLAAGRYLIVFDPQRDNLPSHREFITLAEGDSYELNFDFSEAVELTGPATVGSAPWDGRVLLNLLPVGGGERVGVKAVGNGQISAFVQPGDYDLAVTSSPSREIIHWFMSEDRWGGIAATVSVPAEPRTQEVVWNVALTRAQVEIQLAEGETFHPGQIDLAQRLGGGRIRDNTVVMRMSGSQAVLNDLPPGEYKAMFLSDDGERRGESEWTAIAAGASLDENRLVIAPQGHIRARVGGWTPNDVTEDYKPIIFDITGVVTEPGDYEICFWYEKGVHALAMESVQLFENSNEISRDFHFGWTGNEKYGHIYHVHISAVRPGATYMLAASVRSDGGTDSTGSVYWSKGGLK